MTKLLKTVKCRSSAKGKYLVFLPQQRNVCQGSFVSLRTLLFLKREILLELVGRWGKNLVKQYGKMLVSDLKELKGTTVV